MLDSISLTVVKRMTMAMTVLAMAVGIMIKVGIMMVLVGTVSAPVHGPHEAVSQGMDKEEGREEGKDLIYGAVDVSAHLFDDQVTLGDSVADVFGLRVRMDGPVWVETF